MVTVTMVKGERESRGWTMTDKEQRGEGRRAMDVETVVTEPRKGRRNTRDTREGMKGE